MQVSVNTVMEAYERLENIGKVEARRQSGYYVRCRLPGPGTDLAKGEAATERFAKLLMARWMYTLVGNPGWRMQLWKNGAR